MCVFPQSCRQSKSEPLRVDILSFSPFGALYFDGVVVTPDCHDPLPDSRALQDSTDSGPGA